MPRPSTLGLVGALALAGVLTIVVLVSAGLLLQPHPDGPLATAAARGDDAAVARLVAEGGDPNGLSHEVRLLSWAARQGRVGAMRVLLAAGADPNAGDATSKGWTPLVNAVHTGQAAAVTLLLASGADPDRRAADGTAPLVLASAQGDAATVAALLQAGADARQASRDGMNPLQAAVMGGDLDCVRRILAAAPEPLPPGLRSRLVRGLARIRGDREILALLDHPSVDAARND